VVTPAAGRLQRLRIGPRRWHRPRTHSLRADGIKYAGCWHDRGSVYICCAAPSTFAMLPAQCTSCEASVNSTAAARCSGRQCARNFSCVFQGSQRGHLPTEQSVEFRASRDAQFMLMSPLRPTGPVAHVQSPYAWTSTMTWVGMLAPLLGEYAVTSRRPLRQFRLAGVAAGLAVYAEGRGGTRRRWSWTAWTGRARHW
jgi:hypothetical protein